MGILLLAAAACSFSAPANTDPDAATGPNRDAATADAPATSACGPAYPGGYRLIDAPMSWDAARAACAVDGTDLVIITGDAQNQTVIDIRDAAGLGSIWVGATDQGSEGQWRWVDGAPLSGGFEGWNGGEPNDGGLFEDEDCAEFEGAGWNDTECDSDHPAVCECNL